MLDRGKRIQLQNLGGLRVKVNNIFTLSLDFHTYAV